MKKIHSVTANITIHVSDNDNKMQGQFKIKPSLYGSLDILIETLTRIKLNMVKDGYEQNA